MMAILDYILTGIFDSDIVYLQVFCKVDLVDQTSLMFSHVNIAVDSKFSRSLVQLNTGQFMT